MAMTLFWWLWIVLDHCGLVVTGHGLFGSFLTLVCMLAGDEKSTTKRLPQTVGCYSKLLYLSTEVDSILNQTLQLTLIIFRAINIFNIKFS